MKDKKDLTYYLNLPWTYTIETESHKGKHYYVIRVNELPGICTDAEELNEGMEDIKEPIACAVELYKEKGEAIPEPIQREQFKGNILYRTDSDRHYRLAKAAKLEHKSISRFIDQVVDAGLRQLRY